MQPEIEHVATGWRLGVRMKRRGANGMMRISDLFLVRVLALPALPTY